MNAPRRYRAFISYSHSDGPLSAWLHRSLESYAVPRRLRGSEGEFGAVPDRIEPIFRDREELASAGALGGRLQDALRQSDALLVICSPAAARSRWVNEEILFFKRLGRGHRIYCLLVAGEPNSGDERECFPPALRFEIEPDGALGQRPAEPVAADIRTGTDGRKLARLKLIAGLLGVDLDLLRRRDAQRRHRRMLGTVIASVAGMILALGLATMAWIARNDAQRHRAQADDLIVFMLGDLHEKLEKVGRLDLLDTLGDKAIEYFNRLDPHDMDDNTLEQLAKALMQLGQVRLSQGRYADALASFREGYVRSKALAERHRGDGDRLFDRGQAEYWIGYVYWQGRDLERAQTWLTRYRDTCREVHAIDPKRVDWQHEMAYGDHNLAVLEFERGQLAQAAQGFATARAALESVLARTPDDPGLQFEVADEVSWQGSVEEHYGRLDTAEAALASKAAILGNIASRLPSDPHWQAEWSNAELMQSGLLRVRGHYPEAEALATQAMRRFGPLMAHDPGNKDWSEGYLHALVQRAAARIGGGKLQGARRDLALAKPLMDASLDAEKDNRLVQRDLLDARSLRVMLALHDGNAAAARRAAAVLLAGYRGEPTLNSPEDVGRYGMSEVLAGMADAAAGDRIGAQEHFDAANHALASPARNSRYWRILDPWARLSLLIGDAVEAARARTLLASYGYVPLPEWPTLAEAGPESAAGDVAARRPALSTASPPRAPARVSESHTSATPPGAVASHR